MGAGMSQDEYTAKALQNIKQLSGNTQGQDIDRLNNGRFTDNGAYNKNNADGGNIKMLPKNTLFVGTIISASLISEINTDYPANITARVTQNVYDSETGKILLIPQGSILQGDYSSSAIGIAKVQIAWTSLTVSRNGISYMVSLGGMAGVDKRGRAGIKGTLDDHLFEYFKAAGIMSMFTVINSVMTTYNKTQKKQVLNDVVNDSNSIVEKIGDKLVSRALDIQPTVSVPNGERVNVMVNTPLTLIPFDSFTPKERYVRK